MVSSAIRSSSQRFIWAQAACNTHSPSGMMRPVSSATEMKLAAGIISPPGGFQRTSASTPTMRQSDIATSGW